MKLFTFQKLYNDSDGFSYGVHFSRDREAFRFFSTYSKAIGDIKNKKFDQGHDWWKITEEDYEMLLSLEESTVTKKSSKPTWMATIVEQKKKEQAQKKKSVNKEIKLGDVPTQDVTGFESMGEWMKLTPYNYQKEIIKFCLDTQTSLIVSPCGSGRQVA